MSKANQVSAADAYFRNYKANYQGSVQQFIQGMSIMLILLSLFGLLWSVPFPYLKFLGKYNGYFNWASFLIAVMVFGYYKISPILSYCVLLLLFGFSYIIINLDIWQKAGGPMLWAISAIVFIISFSIQFITFKTGQTNKSLGADLKFLLIAPVWVLHFMLKRFGIKY